MRFIRRLYNYYLHPDKELARRLKSLVGFTPVQPYTDENELISWHWDSSKEKAIKGINFITVMYYAEEIRLPVTYELVEKTETYIDRKTGKTRRRSNVSKNTRMRRMLLICVYNKIKFKYDYWLIDLFFENE